MNVQVPVTAAHLYDAIKIYARSVAKIINSGGDFRNGTAVLEKIINQTYNSLQGFDVSLVFIQVFTFSVKVYYDFPIKPKIVGVHRWKRGCRRKL